MQLFLLQHYLDEVQVFARARLHGAAVAYGVFVLLLEPIRPDLVVALHFADLEHLGATALADDRAPIIRVAHIGELLGGP